MRRAGAAVGLIIGLSALLATPQSAAVPPSWTTLNAGDSVTFAVGDLGSECDAYRPAKPAMHIDRIVFVCASPSGLFAEVLRSDMWWTSPYRPDGEISSITISRDTTSLNATVGNVTTTLADVTAAGRVSVIALIREKPSADGPPAKIAGEPQEVALPLLAISPPTVNDRTVAASERVEMSVELSPLRRPLWIHTELWAGKLLARSEAVSIEAPTTVRMSFLPKAPDHYDLTIRVVDAKTGAVIGTSAPILVEVDLPPLNLLQRLASDPALAILVAVATTLAGAAAVIQVRDWWVGRRRSDVSQGTVGLR